MKVIFPFCFVFFSCFVFSQQIERPKKIKSYEDTVYLVFKSILKTDQYYTPKRLIPTTVRNKFYETNLNIITNYIDKGFLQKDSCDIYSQKLYVTLRQSTHISFLHILKYSPDLLLNETFIKYLEFKIKENKFYKKLIIESLEFFYSVLVWENYHEG